MMGIPRDHTTPYVKRDRCHECDEKFKQGETVKSGKVLEIQLFDDPWATEPCSVRVHTENDDGHGSCLDKLTDPGWGNFRYFDCPKCNRLVVSQCLDNGWRSFGKVYGDEVICVKCYQAIILDEGETYSTLSGRRIPGDFYNDSDLSVNGWKLVPGMDRKHIASLESARAFNKIARGLIDNNCLVLVNYGPMGIGGGEGYVSLYGKPADWRSIHPHA